MMGKPKKTLELRKGPSWVDVKELEDLRSGFSSFPSPERIRDFIVSNMKILTLDPCASFCYADRAGYFALVLWLVNKQDA